MKLVIKIGGAALDDKEVVSTFAKAIPSLRREGHKLVIVHGGGAALSRTLKQLGCETTFVNGLRVTDSQTRDVAMMVLAGQLNKQLVAAIGEAGSARDRHVWRRSAHGAGVEEEASRSRLCRRDLRVDAQWIERFWDAGVVPVISSLALGFDGEYYNVNADQMASAFAIACGAHALVYLTDVAGVKDADGSVLRWLEVNAIAEMVEAATVSGGMLPKLEACTSALKKGVTRVRILPATRAEVLPGFFTHPIDCGTEVIAS